MLVSLELTNFKRHESLSVNFLEGMNILKGGNEDGKTTILEAVGYAFWGSRFLPESLEETVTWTKAVSSLKVVLKFLFDGGEFTITRSKSGAELNGPSVKVSGQDAVTGFVESLFKVSMKTAKLILIASQDEVRGSMDSGAIQLIEKLADMKLIDESVSNIQTYLPSGNTKALDAQVSTLEASLVKPASKDFAEEEAMLAELDSQIGIAKAHQTEAARIEKDMAEPLKAAQDFLAYSQAQTRANGEKKTRIASLMAEKAGLKVPTFGDIEALEAKKSQQQADKIATEKWKLWQGLSSTTKTYPSREWVELEVARLQGVSTALEAEFRELELSFVRKEGTLILQTACGLCGKDLANVPEVVETNNRVRSELEGMSAKKLEVNAARSVASSELSHLQADYKTGAAQDKVKPQLEGYVSYVGDGWPSVSAWVSHAVPSEPDTVDYDKLIKAERNLRVTAEAVLVRDAALESEIAELQRQITEFKDLSKEELEAKTFLGQVGVMRAEREIQDANIQALDKEAQDLRHQLELDKQKYLMDLQNYDTGFEQLSGLKNIAAETNDNNALVRKLRDLRPIVAKKLWNTVLSSVSTGFSSIRGTPSKVTRTDDSFLIDGRPLGAFSGSTKDALGLAIRVALQKTFLPSLDFIIVDEGAKGMDEARETDMLSMLATSEFKQVLLVTHSNLADTFATNLIQLG